jgi:hypothetical protein
MRFFCTNCGKRVNYDSKKPEVCPFCSFSRNGPVEKEVSANKEAETKITPSSFVIEGETFGRMFLWNMLSVENDDS